jgi:predicted ATP-grasp superfamily ATP-dependent carboligase
MVRFLKRSNKYNGSLKNIDEPIAFVLGPYITAGLGVVRSLGRQGIKVIWVDSNQNQIGFLSKYCNGIICPHPKTNEEEYIDFLLTLGKTLNQKGVLLPIGDIEVTALLKNRQKLQNYYNIPISKLEAGEKLLNKRRFYETLDKYNIPHPKTYYPNDISDVETISKTITYPCIVKPEYSADFVFDFKTKFFKVGSKKQLVSVYNKASTKHHKVMFQELIPGTANHMYGFNAYYDKKFIPHGVFTYRRIREWPHTSGNGCLIKTIQCSDLKEIISPFIKKIKYYGIVDAEFKKDPRDDTFKLLEINPRLWMQNSLPARCGINLPYIAYLDATGKDVKKSTYNRQRVKWLFMVEDVRSSLKSISQGDLSFQEWIRSYNGKKEYAVFSKNDPLPFFALSTKLIYSIFSYLF